MRGLPGIGHVIALANRVAYVEGLIIVYCAEAGMAPTMGNLVLLIISAATGLFALIVQIYVSKSHGIHIPATVGVQ